MDRQPRRSSRRPPRPSSRRKRTVIEVPFGRFLGVEIATEPERLLKLRARKRYLNHLGIVHASAQLALAEMTSGEFLLRHVRWPKQLFAVVRRAEAKFHAPAGGPLTSSATVDEDAFDRLATELAAKGRTFISVTVGVHDQAGQRTLSAAFEWFIRVRPKRTRS